MWGLLVYFIHIAPILDVPKPAAHGFPSHWYSWSPLVVPVVTCNCGVVVCCQDEGYM